MDSLLEDQEKIKSRYDLGKKGVRVNERRVSGVTIRVLGF